MDRRTFLHVSALAAANYPLGFQAFSPNMRFKIGACDWSIGQDSNVSVFELAKKIGLQGVQVNLGSLENNMHLRQKSLQSAYKKASKETGVKIASLAIGALNNYPYKSDPQTEAWVIDSIKVAKALKVNVVLLAFFAKNDLRKDDAGKAEVVRRLKIAAPLAEKAGITLGIESYLSAEEHLDIMEKVGSPAIKVYYDFRNSADAGYDIFHEIKLLGKDNICELHMKENGILLGKGSIDWPRVRKALDEVGYLGDGWMQIEWAMPNGGDVVECYKHNLKYLQDIFA
jgi:L-ribulose-5-phosphate 3-epimerase